MDAELNLPDERYSLELRRRIAIEAAKSSFNETMDSIGRATGGHVPKRQIEELVKRAAQDFDAFYETRHAAADTNDRNPAELSFSMEMIQVKTKTGSGC